MSHYSAGIFPAYKTAQASVSSATARNLKITGTSSASAGVKVFTSLPTMTHSVSGVIEGGIIPVGGMDEVHINVLIDGTPTTMDVTAYLYGIYENTGSGGVPTTWTSNYLGSLRSTAYTTHTIEISGTTYAFGTTLTYSGTNGILPMLDAVIGATSSAADTASIIPSLGIPYLGGAQYLAIAFAATGTNNYNLNYLVRPVA